MVRVQLPQYLPFLQGHIAVLYAIPTGLVGWGFYGERMGIRLKGRPWRVLNYVVCEPNEWTTRQIFEDLEDQQHAIVNTVIKLKKLGYVKTGKDVGKAKALVPTREGVRAFEEARE